MAREPAVDQQQPPKKTKKNSPQSLSLRGRALRLLGRREFSRQELEKRLRGYVGNAAESENIDSPADLEALLNDLAERGWLSDARYADTVVRKRTGQFARRSIAQELKRAGVNEEVTDTALAAIDPDEEFALALALCQRKFRRPPADQKEKARQIRFLQSRGYGLSLVLRVLKQVGTGEEGADD
jgi:regulatory protein